MATVLVAAHLLVTGADLGSPTSHAAALAVLADLGVLADTPDPDVPVSRDALAIVLARLLDRLLLEGLLFPAA
ncbi:MAG: hypothetical protein ACRDUY_15735 [Nitriliruptorales bacterium]